MSASADPREFWRSRLSAPNYKVGDAARYAHIDRSTVGRWHRDTTLSEREEGARLSYLELVEVAVVAAYRKAGMKLREIREARAWLSEMFNEEYPFATLRLKTDGVDLMIDHGDTVVLANRRGQFAWKHIIARRFHEFDYEGGIAARWHVAGRSAPIIIDPRIQFGAPSVRGVPTWSLVGRWSAGEELKEIAEDYDIPPSAVIHALKFEGVDPSASRGWLN